MGEIISVSVYSNALDLFFFKTQHTMEETESKINVVHYCDHDISVERGNIMTAGHDLPSAVEAVFSEGPVLPYEIFSCFCASSGPVYLFWVCSCKSNQSV